MAVRVQGIASPERTGDICGCDAAGAKDDLNALVERGWLKYREGRLPGFALTPEGLEQLESLIADEGLRTSEDLSDLYERFVAVDVPVKKACERSQIDFEEGLHMLEQIHDKAKVIVRKITREAPRYAVYGQRLDSCMRRLLDGDRDAFTKPMTESYHHVWWELHTDLATTLGVEKES
jgi:hypothetical protein